MFPSSYSLEHHRQSSQDTSQGHLLPPHSAPSSSSSIHPTMSTRQESIHKETESTSPPYGSRSGPSRSPRGDPRPDHRFSAARNDVPWDHSTGMNKTQSPEISEIADGESWSTRPHAQSFQDKMSRRPSKRKYDEHSDTTLSTTLTDHQSTNLVLPPAPFMNPLFRFPPASAAQSSSSSSINPHNGPPPAILLLDADLWMEFHEQQNEMIITKSGRCLFPCLKFKAVHLDPDAYYSFRLDFETLTPNRFRFYNGSWRVVESLKHADDDSQDSTDPNGANSVLLGEYYTHPDRFQLGSHWMANPISFAKAKLTNKTESHSSVVKRAAKNRTRKGDDFDAPHGSKNLGGANRINTNVFHMTSFHKYRPRLCLIQRGKGSNAIIESTTYRYDRTEFMAVTHYQNYKVNDLKKSYNPHAKGFRGTIGKVLPPVKVPAEQQQRQKRPAPDSQSSMTTRPLRASKRFRTSWRSDEIDSGDGMDGDDNDLDSLTSDMSVVADMGTSSRGRTGKNMNRAGSEAMMAARTLSITARVRRENKKANTSCRLNKDNNALITISLGEGQQDDGKVSEQTTTHYFDQPSALNGEATIIPGYNSLSSTTETIRKTGQRLFPPANNAGDGVMRSRHFTGMDQPPPYYQQQQHQENLQQSHSVTGQQNDEADERNSRRARSHLHPLFSKRAPTTRLDSVSTHLSDNNDHASNSLSMLSPTSTSSMNAGRGAVYLGNSDDDNDNAAVLLHFNQSAHVIPLEPLEDTIISDQGPVQVPSTDLRGTAGTFVSDDASSNFGVPSVSVFGTGTSTPSSMLSGSSSSSHSSSSSLLSGRPQMDNGLTTSGTYGGGFSGHGGNHASDVGAVPRNGGLQQDPHKMKTTILESKTFMSTSSAASIVPSFGQQPPHQAELHRLLCENRRLRIFIRERYGPEAEAELNALIAMEQHHY
ncbi:hypothetical protein BGZ95_000721 [Linnemannia exigua]|uniref:T-box domain-containing protein n=1 Tax=Linnemannia exigua TaxID=604196 RepID=A0AAD4D859_9FUNG|nr:hypothetical protein BGZ95_000721 [Linnemannia exigua]